MDTPKELLRQRPLPQFGANPYHEALYRVVFAPTRLHIVSGLWNDGQRGVKWCPKYPEVGEKWVLERWMTPFEFARCTPQEWTDNPMLSALGPYPERGEYEICHAFSRVTPEDENIESVIAVIEMGYKNTRRVGNVFDNPENTAACHQIQADKDAAIASEMQARIENLFPAYGGVPMAGYGGSRGTKAFPVKLFAHEARLPTMPAPKERGKHNSRSTFMSADRLLPYTQPSEP